MSQVRLTIRTHTTLNRLTVLQQGVHVRIGYLGDVEVVVTECDGVDDVVPEGGETTGVLILVL